MEPKEKTIHLLRNDTCESCLITGEMQHAYLGHLITADLLHNIQLYLESSGCKCKVAQHGANEISLNVPDEWICENYKKVQRVIIT